jgi:exodeoxyribonuclease VII small subunit
MPPAEPAPLPADLTFEQALRRLEEIVRLLEEHSATLEEALAAHAEGTALARFCMARLAAAELRVQELTLE